MSASQHSWLPDSLHATNIALDRTAIIRAFAAFADFSPVKEKKRVTISERCGAAVPSLALESRQLVEPAPPLSCLLIKLEFEPRQCLHPMGTQQGIR